MSVNERSTKEEVTEQTNDIKTDIDNLNLRCTIQVFERG